MHSNKNWTGRSGVLRFMGLRRVGHDWATELNKQMNFLKSHSTFEFVLNQNQGRMKKKNLSEFNKIQGENLLKTLPGIINSWRQLCSVQSLICVQHLQPHGLQHGRLPCPSPVPRACSNTCPSRQWCHPTIPSSVIPFSCHQSFPASGSFPESVLCIRCPKYWNFSISPSNEYSVLLSFKIDWYDFLAVQGTPKSLL